MIVFAPRLHILDRHGKPVAGGMVYTYEAGSSTPKTSYSDPDMTVLNAWPLILDADGKADYFISGSYKVVVKDANGVTIDSKDRLWGFGGSGLRGFSGEPGKLAAWDETGEELTTSDLAERAIQFPVVGANPILPDIPGRAGRMLSCDFFGNVQVIPIETFLATLSGSEDWGNLSPVDVPVDDWGTL